MHVQCHFHYFKTTVRPVCSKVLNNVTQDYSIIDDEVHRTQPTLHLSVPTTNIKTGVYKPVAVHQLTIILSQSITVSGDVLQLV